MDLILSMVYSIIDFILHIDLHLSSLVVAYGTYIYLILFMIVFCETGLVITPFLPGDSLLFVAGALAAMTNNQMNVHCVALVIICAAFLGDTANYAIGKYFGNRFFTKKKEAKLFKQSYLERTENFYERHGRKTIIIARFIPIVRTFAPFIAGMSRMTYYIFMFYNLLGALLWSALFVYLGYFFGDIPIIKQNLSLLLILIIFISLLPAILGFIKGYMYNNALNNRK